MMSVQLLLVRVSGTNTSRSWEGEMEIVVGWTKMNGGGKWRRDADGIEIT